MTYPFRQARWYQPASRQLGDIWWIVLHCPQYPEDSQAAEQLAAYFATTDRKASTHAVCDNDSLWECVRDDDVAYGASGANAKGLHIEIDGYAEQTEQQWLDPFSTGALRQAAGWTRAKSDLWEIPRRFVAADGLRAGTRGITTHREVEKAWPSTGHVDPGPAFPMSTFLAMCEGGSTTDDEEAMLAWT